jgi:ParB-like chromosome segregation protein Spo0J
MSNPKKPRYQIEMIGIETLIPYARNSRTHSDSQVAQIAGSIREFGFTNPVLIDAESGIIAGHGRVLAARKLELAEVPCIRLAHLTDTQRRAYVIADNKLALNAGWDDEVLGLELADLREVDFDLGLTGFDAEKIEAQLNPNGKANDILKEWEEAQMPNYDGNPKGEGGTIIVHFLSQEDRSRFFEKLSITGSLSSKFCWFPHAP